MPIPEPGTKEYEEMVEFMRYDLEHGGALTKIIMAARKAIESAGKNFDEEFAKWVARRKAEKSGIKSWRDLTPNQRVLNKIQTSMFFGTPKKASKPIKFKDIK